MEKINFLDINDNNKIFFEEKNEENKWYSINSHGYKNWNIEKVKEFYIELYKYTKIPQFSNNSFKNFCFPYLIINNDKIEVIPGIIIEDFDFSKLGNLDFSSSIFYGQVIIKNSNFQEKYGNINFSNSIFKEGLLIIDSTISSQINFSTVNFNDTVFISNSNFNNKLELKFEDTIFDKDFLINLSKFNAKMNLPRSIFNGNMNVSGNEFNKKLDFTYSTFNKNFNFSGNIIKDTLNFYGINFINKVVFDSNKVIKDKIFFNSCEFSNNFLMQNTDLSKILFENSKYLDLINFINISWLYIKGRKGVLNETIIKKEEDYKNIENIYRELKVNFEKKSDWQMAGNFHIGEMEMKYNSLNWFSKKIIDKFILWFYRFFSLYGESVGRPLLGILAMLILSITTIYSLDFDGNFEGGFGDIFLSILRTIFFQKDDNFSKFSIGLKYIISIIQILSPIFLFLLALAIKRKIKR